MLSRTSWVARGSSSPTCKPEVHSWGGRSHPSRKAPPSVGVNNAGPAFAYFSLQINSVSQSLFSLKKTQGKDIFIKGRLSPHSSAVCDFAIAFPAPSLPLVVLSGLEAPGRRPATSAWMLGGCDAVLKHMLVTACRGHSLCWPGMPQRWGLCPGFAVFFLL